MFVLLALVIGCLFATGMYQMLRRSMTRLIFGIVLITHGANLLIFTASGLTLASPPLVPEGLEAPPPGHADPIPQALVLTAIVIGFAVVAFTSVLVARAYTVLDTGDLAEVHHDPGGDDG